VELHNGFFSEKNNNCVYIAQGKEMEAVTK
jgi:hypothetical protein